MKISEDKKERKWTKGLDVNPKPVKFPEENIEHFHDLEFGRVLRYDTKSVIQKMFKSDRLVVINIKNSCSLKDIIKRMKQQSISWEKKNIWYSGKGKTIGKENHKSEVSRG